MDLSNDAGEAGRVVHYILTDVAANGARRASAGVSLGKRLLRRPCHVNERANSALSPELEAAVTVRLDDRAGHPIRFGLRGRWTLSRGVTERCLAGVKSAPRAVSIQSVKSIVRASALGGAS